MTLQSCVGGLVLAILLAAEGVAQTRYYAPPPPPPRKTGPLGVLGGLAGAGIGAAIGQDGGDAVPGAIIGGAIGAVSGVAVGSAIDQDAAYRQEYLNTQYQQQQEQVAQAVTMQEVVSMTHAGLSDDVIIAQIRNKGLVAPLQTNDLIVLKQHGVSDRVVSTMQNAALTTVVLGPPTPVVVRDHYYHGPYGPPVWYHHSPYRYPHHHPQSYPRTSFNFRIGH